jgi:hypothetical protein
VLLRYNQGSTGVAFRAPVPVASGLTYAGESTSFYRVGNSQSGVSVGFGSCVIDATVHVMAMQFVRTSEGSSCTLYTIEPNAYFSDCFAVDNPIREYDGVALNSNGQCNPVPIHNEAPVDGAVDVSLMTQLSWENGYYLCNAPLLVTDAAASASLYFGTSTDPPFVGVITSPHKIGPLQPSTKYYWRVHSEDWPYLGSPVWSFTTTNSVAVQSSTWGAIKALYR